MDETESRDLEPPLSEPRFTMGDACAGSTMTGPRLRKWTNTILKRYFPLRQAGQWMRYSFTDIVQLAIAQELMNVGIGSKRAFEWADEAARGDLRIAEFCGSILIYRDANYENRFRILPDRLGEAALVELDDKELGVYLNVLAVARHVLSRLVVYGAVDSGLKGNFTEVLRENRERRRKEVRSTRSTPASSGKAAGPPQPAPTPSSAAPTPSTRPRRSVRRAPK